MKNMTTMYRKKYIKVLLLLISFMMLMLIPFVRLFLIHIIKYVVPHIDTNFWDDFIYDGALFGSVLLITCIVVEILPIKDNIKRNMPIILFIIVEIFLLGVRVYIYQDISPEVGDGAFVKVVDDFSKGINPYGLEWLNDYNSNPSVILASGFINAFLAVLIKIVFGTSANCACVIMSFIYVIVAQVSMYWLVKKGTSNSTLGLLAAMLIFFSTRRLGYLCLRPDVFCLICIIWIIYIYEESIEKGFSIKRITLVSLLSMIVVFSKIHYALVLFSLLLTLLIFKKKDFVKMLFCCLAFFCIFTLLFQIFFPTFFSTFMVRIYQMIIEMIIPSENNVTADIGIGISIHKWKELVKEYLFTFLIILFYAFMHIKKVLSNLKRERYFFEFSNIVFAVISLWILGCRSDSALQYHYVMLMPFVILVAMRCLDKSVWFSLDKEEVISLFFIVSAIESFMICMPRINIADSKNQMEEYKYVYSLIENSDGKVMLSSNLAPIAINENIYIWNYGDQGYLSPLKEDNIIFPYTNEICERNKEYYKTIVKKVNDKEFSIIIINEYTPYSLGVLGDYSDFENAINQNYELIETKILINETQKLMHYIYYPN